MIDKIGSYKMILFGLLAYACLGFLGFTMTNIGMLLLDRLFLGAVTATLMAASTDLISQFFSGLELLNMIALQGMAIEVGGVLFLGLSGMLAEINWYSSFFIYLFALIPFFLILFKVPRIKGHKENKKRVDSNIEDKSIKSILLVTFFGMIIFFTSIISLPSYLQESLGYSTSFTGYFLAFISLVAVAVAGVMPKVVQRFSVKSNLLIAFMAYAFAHFTLFFARTIPLLIIGAIFMGIGFGLSQPLLNTLVVNRSNIYNKGRKLSLFSIATFLGQFISSIIVVLMTGKYAFLLASILAIIMLIIIYENSSWKAAKEN
jgi:MFS family permease